MKVRCLRCKNEPLVGKESFSSTKSQTLKSHNWKELCSKEKWETATWFLYWHLVLNNNIENAFCSYSAALGWGYMLPESPLGGGEKLVVRDTHWFLFGTYMQPGGELQKVPWLWQGVGRQSQPSCKNMGRVPCPQPARTRLLMGPVVAAPGEWREGWDVTFLRPSQVHVIVARRGKMVWVRSGMERGAGELAWWRAGGTQADRTVSWGSLHSRMMWWFMEFKSMCSRVRETETETWFFHRG